MLSQLESVSLSRRDLTVAFSWSLFNWVADVACLLFATYAAGGRPSLAGLTVAYAAARAVGSIPLMPGGLLVVEAVLVPGLVTSGMSLPDAISAMLIYRLDQLDLHRSHRLGAVLLPVPHREARSTPTPPSAAASMPRAQTPRGATIRRHDREPMSPPCLDVRMRLRFSALAVSAVRVATVCHWTQSGRPPSSPSTATAVTGGPPSPTPAPSARPCSRQLSARCSPPMPVAATDGKTHLAYELVLTNDDRPRGDTDVGGRPWPATSLLDPVR